jgi:ATP synthase protein I
VVPYHNPIPEKKGRSGQSGVFNAWVQAEKLLQIALMLPSAGFIGWLAGYGLDRWLHQAWVAIVGAIFGIIAGLVGVVRMAMVYGHDSGAEPYQGNKDGNGNTRDGSGGAS